MQIFNFNEERKARNANLTIVEENLENLIYFKIHTYYVANKFVSFFFSFFLLDKILRKMHSIFYKYICKYGVSCIILAKILREF